MALTYTPALQLDIPAADFSLPAVDGKKYTLDTTRGLGGLLLMFICNHCPYVQGIRERLVADMHELQSAGIGVVAISSNDAKDYPEDSFENMKRIAKEWGFTFPYLYDESQKVAKQYGAVCTPDFFGFDSELRLKYRGRLDAAGNKPRPAEMKRELVDAMLAVALNQPVDFEQVPSVGCNIKWSI